MPSSRRTRCATSATRSPWSVAESYDQARDAAALVEVDYEELPAVVDVRDALKGGAPAVHDDIPGNTCYVWALGDRAAVDAAFARAAHVTTLEFANNRLIPNAIEPRACNAMYGAATSRTRCSSPTRTRTSNAC
jgi:CO/xanthine dehydrogenase Mo-binding subunit